MKFGPVPVGEAEGAVLAHSLDLPDGRLRKGTLLSREDVDRLRKGGADVVTVARLEPGDWDEDRAAAHLAAALVDGAAGLSVTAAHTGRVNVVADGPGLAVIDAARIDAANGVDPMLTVATVPPFLRMEAGGLVATIKVISYGVAEALTRRAAEAGRGALRFAGPQRRTVALIETRVGRDLGEKGAEALTLRVERLGCLMTGRTVVDHDIGPLATALAAAEGEADVICILTASATSDSHDTAPEAVRRAGGSVTHFGMPVDPGNLLFLGDLRGRPVIGLPGCARSTALNGADWVLERVICGAPVGPDEIAAMGVGGLLKEIPQRGHPRRGRDAGSGADR